MKVETVSNELKKLLPEGVEVSFKDEPICPETKGSMWRKQIILSFSFGEVMITISDRDTSHQVKPDRIEFQVYCEYKDMEGSRHWLKEHPVRKIGLGSKKPDWAIAGEIHKRLLSPNMEAIEAFFDRQLNYDNHQREMEEILASAASSLGVEVNPLSDRRNSLDRQVGSYRRCFGQVRHIEATSRGVDLELSDLSPVQVEAIGKILKAK